MSRILNIMPTGRKFNFNELPDISGEYFSFSQLKGIKVTKDIAINPLDYNCTEDDFIESFVETLKDNPRVFEYLSGLALRNNQEAKLFMNHVVKGSIKGYQFGYLVHNYKSWLGMIFVHTPAYSKIAFNEEIWTIDFFLNSFAEGYGIMTYCLADVLYFLKSTLNVDEVFFFVDINNNRCKRLMNRIQAYKVFDLHDIEDRERIIQHLYKIDLSKAVFQGYE